MIDDQVDAAGLERIEKSFVESRNVRRSHERIMQIVIVLRDFPGRTIRQLLCVSA
jgi:hypothetical protein